MSVKETVCDFDNLYKAMKVCAKNVAWKDSVAGWLRNGGDNCAELQEQLLTGKYKLSRYQVFEIYEPKRRTIVSTRFRDRVFQRSLCDNYLTHEMSRHFIYDCAACLRHRGTDFARKRLKVHLERFYRKHKTNGYVLKIDIKNYFGSTRHDVACREVAKYIRDEWALEHVRQIINSFDSGPDPDVGIGLGSQISQLIQLAMLNGIDHKIVGQWHIKHYVRYMDDLILIHEDKEYLRKVQKLIEAELADLCLKVNPKKTQLFPVTHPISFLGFTYKLTPTGRIVTRVQPQKYKRAKRRIRKQVALAKAGILTKEKVDECNQARRNHLSKAGSYWLLREADEYYKNLWR